MSWSDEVSLEFLELYRREQLLWDPTHPMHNNRREMTKAWQRIQSSLSIHCPILDLKKKKESLMALFRRHCSRKKKYNGDYQTTWFAYPMMESFLGGKYECDSTNQMENELLNNTDCKGSSMMPDASKRHASVMRARTLTKKMKRMNAKIQARNSLRDREFAKNIIAETLSCMKTEESRAAMDECDLYTQLLAKKLRKLDDHQREVAMYEIDGVMFRAKSQSHQEPPQQLMMVHHGPVGIEVDCDPLKASQNPEGIGSCL